MSYIDRDKFIDNLATDRWGVTNMINVGIALDKSVADVVDAVAVVRCKDCKKAEKTSSGYYTCCYTLGLYHYPRDYCSYGERKEHDYQQE